MTRSEKKNVKARLDALLAQQPRNYSLINPLWMMLASAKQLRSREESRSVDATRIYMQGRQEISR